MRIALILLLCVSPVFADQITQEVVSASSDDASCNGAPSASTGAVSLTLTGPFVGLDAFSNAKTVGMRWLTIPLTSSMAIDSAFVTYTAGSTLSGATCNLRWVGEDTADAATFSNATDWDARNLTTATVDQNAVASQTEGTDYRSPDLKTIIQEIIDRPDWAENNDLVIMVGNNASSSSAYRSIATENHATYTAPRLDVWYHRQTKDTLTVTGTTYVEDNLLWYDYPDSNIGGNGWGQIINGTASEPPFQNVLVINAPAVNDLIPAGWGVTSCTLNIWSFEANSSSGTYSTLQGYQLRKPWYEMFSTYNDWYRVDSEWTVGGAGKSFGVTDEDNAGDGTGMDKRATVFGTYTLTASGQWIKLPMTSVMSDWVTGAAGIRGVRITCTGAGMTKPDTVGVRLSEYPDTLSQRPYFSIVIDSVVSASSVPDYYHGTAGVGVRHSPQGNSVLHKK